MAVAKPAPKPEVFDPKSYGAPHRCMLCDSYPEVRKWLTASLTLTHKSGHVPPSLLRITRRTNEAWGTNLSRSLIERHLRQHEPAWLLWAVNEKG